jgi:acyl-CoA reductase-like NAD-dependent aldehyde dehydrogenase
MVLAGDDLDEATSPAVAGRFGNAGQARMSSKRLIVECAALRGTKNSGIGRELVRFGLDEFANKKLGRIT